MNAFHSASSFWSFGGCADFLRGMRFLEKKLSRSTSIGFHCDGIAAALTTFAHFALPWCHDHAPRAQRPEGQ
jgi:hypothetical protein